MSHGIVSNKSSRNNSNQEKQFIVKWQFYVCIYVENLRPFIVTDPKFGIHLNGLDHWFDCALIWMVITCGPLIKW